MKRWFWVFDVAAVISFAVIGAESHGLTLDLAGVVRVAAPFLIALAGGVILLRAWREPLSLLNGVLLSLITLAVGMLLRRYLWDEGTPRMFLIVTGAYLFAVMVGWRLIGRTVVRFTS